MELYGRVRHAVLVDGMSRPEAARIFGINRRTVEKMFRDGLVNEMDAVRQYAVILDWGSGELMPKSTEQFRQSFERRSVAHWK